MEAAAVVAALPGTASGRGSGIPATAGPTTISAAAAPGGRVVATMGAASGRDNGTPTPAGPTTISAVVAHGVVEAAGREQLPECLRHLCHNAVH